MSRGPLNHCKDFPILSNNIQRKVVPKHNAEYLFFLFSAQMLLYRIIINKLWSRDSLDKSTHYTLTNYFLHRSQGIMNFQTKSIKFSELYYNIFLGTPSRHWGLSKTKVGLNRYLLLIRRMFSCLSNSFKKKIFHFIPNIFYTFEALVSELLYLAS